MSVKIYTLLFFLFATALNLCGQSREYLQKDIDKLVYKRLPVDMERTPGFIVGIINGDSTYVFPYGTLSKDSTLLPTANAIFEIGGLTNIFTAQLVNALIEKGIFDKNKSINTYLPQSLQNPTAQTINLQHLLTHTSGLPRVPLGIGKTQKEDNQPFAFYTKEQLGLAFKKFDFEKVEIRKYSYSHFGFALIELMVEEQMKMPFEAVLYKEILKDKYPSTALTNDTTVLGFDKGHNLTPLWKYKSFAAACGLKSNLNDLLAFLKENIKSDDYAMMYKILIPTEIRENTYAGEAWHIIKHKKYYPVVLHVGATSGHRAYMAFVKETQTGVIVLSNSEFALRGLGYIILNHLNNGWKR